MELGIFGAVSAGIVLCPELLRLSRSLRNTFETIRHAPRDVNKLAKEMEIFAGLYEDFLEVCPSDGKHGARSAAAIKLLTAWAEKAIIGISKLLAQVQAISGDQGNSKIERLKACLKWYFSDRDVKLLRSSLSVARESIIGFSNIRAIERLDDEVRLLEAAMARGSRQTTEEHLGVSLEDKMMLLEQKRRNRRKQRHADDKRRIEAVDDLREQQEKLKSWNSNDVVPETKQLLQFTKSVEHYTEDVLPLRLSGHRRRNRNARATTELRRSRADSVQPSISTRTTMFASDPSSVRPSMEPSVPEPSETIPTNSRIHIEDKGSRLHTGHIKPAIIQFVGQDPSSGIVEAGLDYDSAPQARARYRASNEDGRVGMDPYSPVRSLYKVGTTSGSESTSSLPELLVDRTEGLVNGRNRDCSSEASSSIEDVMWTTTPEDGAIMREESSPVEAEVRGPEESVHSLESEATDDGTDNGTEDEAIDEEEAGAPSPFHPVGGTRGREPRGWRKRHERSESPQDFWHKRL
ncbi:hypothetical protein BKA63DRAFT_152011 [Paraphoma chrysanthemicola]|nr:hypothetical protein BKA63DRAFT_152011 [Paraphoma chrysanthemicola]